MNVILLLMLGGEQLVIPSINNTIRLADATDVFSQIDPDFNNSGAPKEINSTEEIRVYPYELTLKATFAEMFDSLHRDYDLLCLSEHQIREFVVKYSLLIATGLAQFPVLFLSKSNGHFFAIRVGQCEGGFCIERYPLAYYFSWPPDVYHYRVVVPFLRPPCSPVVFKRSTTK